jgi:uncharacterized membrane protein
MAVLIAGLVIFLGVHSVRIVAEEWRARQLARFGEGAWKGAYSLVAAIGLGLIVWGYGMSRIQPTAVWLPPPWTRDVAALLTLPAFVLLVAAYVPGNRIRSAVGHPMVLGVALWALAHLAANGTLADVLLFGSFLGWAVLDFRAARQRERATRTVAAGAHRGSAAARDALTVALGVALWAAFATFLHEWLFGVRPIV